MKKPILSLILIMACAFYVGCSDETVAPPTPTACDDVVKAGSPYNLNIVPPDAAPYGKTYSEWSAEWWKWLWSAPVEVNPGLDDTGDDVGWNQSGPVWFLAPAYFSQWERTATIPNGKMLFIDLAGYFVSTSMGDGTNEAELREATEAFVDQAISNVIIEVDGQRLQNVEDFRFQSPPGLITYTLPENNMFQWFGYDIAAGTYSDATCEGYYAMLPPLSPGQHTIFLSADFGDPYNDVIQVTYHLTVKRGKSDYEMEY